ncbi:hypothetical protein YC2023_009405 [Brassica napus]
MHELAPYYKEGAYEISFLNITGFRDFPLGDLSMIHVLRLVLRYTSEYVFVPLTVGGGIRDFTDATGSTGGGFSSIFSYEVRCLSTATTTMSGLAPFRWFTRQLIFPDRGLLAAVLQSQDDIALNAIPC